jgi:dihydroorotate dehydrogenase electron transfer subunit
MLKAICTGTDLDGQLSLEERMGCGFGACMGCTVITASGAKRVCKDGPVFRREELGW